MAFNKSKALEEAAKLVGQRKLAQAIKQYLAIAGQDPQDLPLLNTIGDLCVRDGNVPEALRQFHKLAEAYAREGFTLKAIAIYKKIVKLDTGSVDPILRLAELYAGQKLSHEANEQYAQALALCQRNSWSDKTRQILQKLVAQDPENVAGRMRLAQFYHNAGQIKDAYAVYLETVEAAHRHQDHGAAEMAINKAAEIDSNSREIHLWRARLALAARQFDETCRILAALPELGSSPEGQRLLLEAHLASWRLEEARSLVVNACRRAPEGFGMLELFVTRSLESGNPDAVLAALGDVTDLAVQRGQSRELLPLLQRALAAHPREAASLDVAGALCDRIGVAPPEILELLGKSFAEAGLWAKAESLFQRLTALDPENGSWQLLRKEAREKQRPQETDEAAVPAASLMPEENPEELRLPSQIQECAEPPHALTVEIDFSSEWDGFRATHAAPAEEPPPLMDAGPASSPPAEPLQAEELPRDLLAIHDECAEAQFYLDHGFLAEAAQAVDKLAAKYPGNPQVSGLQSRVELLARDQQSEAEPEPEAQKPSPLPFFAPSSEPFPETGNPSPEIDLPGVNPEVTPAQTAASGALVSHPAQEQWWDGQGRGITEPPEVAAPVYSPEAGEGAITRQTGGDLGPATRKAIESTASAPNWGESLLSDLAREIEELLPAGDEMTSAPTPSAGVESSLFNSSFEELLSELEGGQEASPNDDSPQTHYNLGVAFREMGLLDEAIGEFQKTVKGATEHNPPPRFLEACSLLGLCFMEKRMPEIASRWYLRALQMPGLDEETMMALTYDLAGAYEKSGDVKSALEKFSEVYSLNIDYRDVAEKIQSLHQKRA